MTEAYEFYGDLASLHGLTVPDILSGEPVPVTDPAFSLPVHGVEPEKLTERLETLESNCSDRFGQATEFLRSVVLADNPQLEQKSAASTLPKSVVSKLFADLIPPKLITGRISDFRIQAISQAEAPDSAIALFDRNARASLRTELFYGTAHFLASAELHSGRILGRVGRVARLAIVGRHDQSFRLRSLEPKPYMLSYKMHESDWEVSDAMRRIRGRAWWAQRYAMKHPFTGGTVSGK